MKNSGARCPITVDRYKTFFQSSNDYIAISGRRRSLKASGSRRSLDCEWRSMLDFSLVKNDG